MLEWQRYVQQLVDEIDGCIQKKSDDTLTLTYLAQKLGYSEYHLSRKFKEISGMQFRDYLRYR